VGEDGVRVGLKERTVLWKYEDSPFNSLSVLTGEQISQVGLDCRVPALSGSGYPGVLPRNV
jgi:hypothetical protein